MCFLFFPHSAYDGNDFVLVDNFCVCERTYVLKWCYENDSKIRELILMIDFFVYTVMCRPNYNNLTTACQEAIWAFFLMKAKAGSSETSC